MAKLTKEHLAYIRAAVVPLDTSLSRDAYKAASLSDKRYRWDLMYKANLSTWICDNIYSYADDSHIDTALRSMVAPLYVH